MLRIQVFMSGIVIEQALKRLFSRTDNSECTSMTQIPIQKRRLPHDHFWDRYSEQLQEDVLEISCPDCLGLQDVSSPLRAKLNPKP